MSLKVEYHSCPCCNSDLIEQKILTKDYTTSNEFFEVWECRRCELRFTQNAPAPSEIGKYYNSNNYLSHSTSSESFFNKFYQTARKYSVKWRYNLVTKVCNIKKGTLLDIGSGTGAFPAYMNKKGWLTTSLEPDVEARETAYHEFHITLRPMEDLHSLSSNSFDAITMWHVLEHVHNPKAYIHELHRLLKPDGVIFIAMPNYKSFDSNFYGKFWDAYDVPRHLFHFSFNSFEQVVKDYSFKIVSIKAFWLDPYYTCLQSEEHKFNKKRWASAIIYGSLSLISGFFNIKKASTITYILKNNIIR